MFLKTKEEFGGLSNMAAGYKIIVNNTVFKTSEALYQVCRFPLHPKIQQEIIDANSPMTAKMKSKKYKNFTREDWDDVRVSIMRWSLRAKLFCNWNKFGSLLQATEELTIVEESRKDAFWGARAIDDNFLKGNNVLGRLLMETRNLYLKHNCPNEKLVLKPVNIPNFLILGKPVEHIFLIVCIEEKESRKQQLSFLNK